MATVDKAFRVKNGLIVEGSSATVNGSSVLTEASTEFLQDTTAAMFDGAQSGIAFEYNDTTGKITATVSTDPLFGDKITFEGTTPDAYELILQVVDPVADVTVTLPNATDTLVGKATTDTLTNKSISGATNTLSAIANSSLTNSSVTVNGTSISLGATETITAVNPNALTIGTGLSGTSYSGSSAVTVAIDSTVATTSGTQTLTNKTISGTSNTITDIANNSLSNSSVTINTNSLSLGGSLTLDTDDIAEAVSSPTNLWFTAERAQDAVAQAIANGTQTNITITYDDNANSLSFNAAGGVSSIAGTTNQITASASTGAVTLSLPSAVTFPGSVTLNAAPTEDLQAATKGYVDSVAQGLDIKASVKAATTENGTLASAFDDGSVIDGVTLATGDRILIKNQTDATANGIYVVAASGAPTRSTDMNAAAEFPGAFTFVEQGTTNADTGYVCTNNSVVVGTTEITFAQFSGAGSYVAGNGITLTGNSFSINTGVTADLSTAQTLTNKTLTSPVVTGLKLDDSSIVFEGTANDHETTLTVTDPTADRTITLQDASGTVAFTADISSAIDSFGGAVTGGTGISASYASTSDILTITNTDLGSSQNIFKNVVVGATTIAADSNDDTLTFVAGSGISLSAASTSDTITIDNSGVLSITGTTDQITASASTGAVTLSLPQSIATTSSPSFAGLTVGSVTLTDALMGTATTSLSTTSPTVVDTWSATTYSTAKYIVQMTSGNDIEVLEVLVTIDGNDNVYITEYADVISNTQIGTTDADFSGGNVRLLVTSVDGATVKVHKTLIEA